MTGSDLRELRHRTNLPIIDFGLALGYGGNTKNVWRKVRRLEQMAVLPEPVVLRATAVELDLATAERRAQRHSGDECARCLPTSKL